MPRFSDEIIDKVVKASDLVALARHHVDLQKAGRSWRGLCPFHAEKTPSFFIDPEKGTFYCFGCGEGGGVIKFHMLTGGLSFPEAVRDLGQRAGIEMPEPTGGPAPVLDGRPQKTVLYELMKLASDYYQNELWRPAGRGALAYLVEERGLSQEVVKSFSLGLAPDSWDALLSDLSKKRFSHKALMAAGLIKPRSQGEGFYDVFRHRLMIPVTDIENRTVALAGRVWEKPVDPQSPKYVNSPATDIYVKGRLLYGLHQAKPHVRAGGLVFLVEGYFDLISLVSYGVKPVAAVMGTALTSYQLSAIKSMAKEVHLVFDSDSAGEEATKRALPLLYNAEMDGRVIRLPEGHDPDSFVREHGPRAFFDLAESAMDIADYFVSRLQRSPGGTLTGDAQLVSKAQEVLSQVPDAAKSQYLRVRLAERLGISPELLKPDPHSRRIYLPPPPPKEAGPGKAVRRDRLAEKLILQVVIHPETAELLEGDLAEAWPDDPTRPVLEAVLGQLRSQGRLVPESLRLDYDAKASSLVSGALMSQRQWPSGTLPGQSLEGVGKLADKLKHNLLRALQKEISLEVFKAQAAGDQARIEWLFAAKDELAKGSLRPMEAAAKIRGQGSSSEGRDLAPAPKPVPV